MYVFAVAALLGLGVFALAMIANRYLSMARELWVFVLIALGVGAAWLVDFDVFRLWGIDARADWIGVTLTGLMIGGLGYVCRGAAHLTAELTRIVGDEAETLEKEKDLRRVA
jgi:hypothetical protein